MAAHKTNGLLKFALPILIVIIVGFLVHHHDRSATPHPHATKISASQDSAAESLNTLTAQLADTQKNVKAVVTANADLQQQNTTLHNQLQSKQNQANQTLSEQIAQLKNQLEGLHSHEDHAANTVNSAEPITSVPELGETLIDPKEKMNRLEKSSQDQTKKDAAIPYYTIPANATAVEDQLMTPLVGRIPVKGVVTDPYPFKIVFSDNTLAANGLRVPNLKQMIVSGYTEGDLNLISTRGWVTSLTFVFTDGTISTTSSNDNNIGKFSKDNALGYLSDERGNPAIRGKLITNAPIYLGVNIALGAAQGAANAYAQAQTTNSSTLVGSNTSSVTGSQTAYVAGQTVSGSASQVQQWWHDREENSFDAVFVPTIKADGQPQMIAVNFAKEIHIDYDPQGRKIVYAHDHSDLHRNLD